MWICSCETWNLTSLTMKGKAFQISSWDVICSPPWEQWKRWVPIEFRSWPQTWMPWTNPRTKGWRKSKLVHNVKKKTLKVKWKDVMTRWAKTQVLAPKPLQNLKCAWCKSKTCQKWYWRKNDCAIYLKCYLEVDLLSFLLTTQKKDASHHIQRKEFSHHP
jgi:hypothetical protein